MRQVFTPRMTRTFFPGFFRVACNKKSKRINKLVITTEKGSLPKTEDITNRQFFNKIFTYPRRKSIWALMESNIRSMNTSAFSAFGPRNQVPTAAHGFVTSSLTSRLEKMPRLWVNMGGFPLPFCFSFPPLRDVFFLGLNIACLGATAHCSNVF